MNASIQSRDLAKSGGRVVLLLSLCGQVLAADLPTITSPTSAVASNGYSFGCQIAAT